MASFRSIIGTANGCIESGLQRSLLFHQNPGAMPQAGMRQRLWRYCSLTAINEIDKRTPDALEHVAGFILSATECRSDSSLGCANNSALVFRIPLRIAVGLHVLHVGTGKHPLGACNIAAIRADMNRTNGPRPVLEGNNPDRVAALVRAQGVGGGGKARVRLIRSVARHGVSAAGIKI